MIQRRQDIAGRLDRPPADRIRQVFALARSDAEKLPRMRSIAVISITAPERPPASLDGFNQVLRLSFADVDFLKPDLSSKAQEKLVWAFTAEQAQSVGSFVEALPDEIASIVAYCEGGYSRSCAIALALHRLFGYHVEIEHLSQANPSIVSLMMADCPHDRGGNNGGDDVRFRAEGGAS